MDSTEAPFVFSSPPSVPRERGGDILVKIQAVSSSNPCLLVKSYRLSSKSSVLDVRKKIQTEFNQVFENGFIFLCKNREIITSSEGDLRLCDILPKAGLGKPTNKSFQYPADVSYKDISFERDGRRYMVTCVGLLFLFDASGVSHWNHDGLRQKLDARSMFGFSFIPTDITSARPDVNGSMVDELSQFAAVAKLEVEEAPVDPKTEAKARQIDYGIYKERIEGFLQKKGRIVTEESLKDQRLATPLHYAAQGGHLNMCQFLCMRLDKYKLMYEKDVNGRTPLHCALIQHGITSNKGHLNVAAYLLSFQPDLDSPDVNGMSCYYMILNLKKKDTVHLLQQLDPDIIDEKLVLHFTCCALQYKELKHALSFSAVVRTVKPTFLRPPLHLAAEFGNVNIIQNLLNGGHSALDRDPNGHLPFHYACQHNKSDFVKLLIDKKMKNEDVSKGVRVALNSRNFELIGRIAEMDVDIDLDQETSQSLLKEAQKNLKKYGQSLLKCFKNNPEQLSPFVGQAAYLGLTDLLEYLLSVCPPDATDIMKRTALHDAVQGCVDKGGNAKRDKKNKRCLQAFKLLVNKTKNLHVVDWRNSTPLHYACMDGNLEFVKFMLSQEDLGFASVRDAMGRTALLIAAHYKKGRKVLGYMINHHLEHLDPYAMDAYGKNILHYVGYMDHALIDVLLKKMKRLQNKSTGPYRVQNSFSSRSHEKFSRVTQNNTHLEVLDNGNFKCRFCEAIFEDSVDHFCEVIFQTVPPSAGPSALETLIIMNKPETLKKLVTEMPNLMKGEDGVKARFCAVRLWRLKCADVLISSSRDALQYLDKYLLAALDMKPTLLWRHHTHHKEKQCLLSSLRSTPSTEELSRQYAMVEYLLKLGSNPNYLPPQHGYRFGPKTKSSPAKNADIPSSLTRYCTALERAIIIGNWKVVELLLASPLTRTRESFAIHLAAKSGNVKLLQKLLQMYKNEQERFGIPDTQLSFVSMLPNGILGAACVSEKCSFGLFKAIKDSAPEMLKGTKLMTAKLLGSLRPAMLEILKIHDNLPLVLFIQKCQQHLQPEEKEAIVCFILQYGSYPVEMRVKKMSFIHPACELFRAATAKRMWKVIALLLKQSGSTVMKCKLELNEKNMRCHEHIRKHYGKRYVILLDIAFTTPLEILSMISNAYLKAITRADRHVKEQLFRRLVTHSEYRYSSSTNPDDITSSCIEELVGMVWRNHRFSTTSLFHQPKHQALPSFLREQIMPDESEFGTLSLAQLRTVENITCLNASVLKELIHLRTRGLFQRRSARDVLLEQFLIQCLHTRHILALHMAVWYGEYELVKHIVKGNSDPDVSHTDMMKALDLAAWKGDNDMVQLLITHGAVATELTVLCTCLGLEDDQSLYTIQKDDYSPLTTYLRKQNHHQERGHTSRQDEQVGKKKLGQMKYICESTCMKDIPPRYQEALQVAAMDHNWTLVDYLLDQGGAVLELPDLADSSTDESEADTNSRAVKTACIGLKEILSMGSVELALKALRSIQEVLWDELSLKQCIIAASKSGNVPVVEYMLKEIAFKVPTKPGKPNDVSLIYMEVISHLCKNNDITNVRLILQYLKGLNADPWESKKLSDPLLGIGLKCAMVQRHWELAHLFLLNGSSCLHEAVPDLDTKRTHHPLPERKGRVTTKRCWDGLKNNSRGVATALESKSSLFLYPESLLNVKKRVSPNTEPSMSHRKEEPTHDAMFKRTKYLIGLSHFGKSLGGTIFHGAAIVGDTHLMTEIIAQPMFKTMMKQVECVSPVVLAISNQHNKAVQLCLKYSELISDPVTVAERASEAIIALLPGIDIVIEKLRRRKVEERDQELNKKVCSLYKSLRLYYLQGIQMHHFLHSSQGSLEELGHYVLDILFLSKKESIPNVVLTVLALLCKPSLFDRLQGRLKPFHKKANLTSMPIIEGWTTADLICFPSIDKEPSDVYECLKHVLSIETLQPGEDTQGLSVKKQIITYALLNNVAIIKPMLKEIIASTSQSEAKTDYFVEFLKMLIQPSKDKNGGSVLHCLARSGDTDSIYWILEHLKTDGIEGQNIRDASGSSPLWYALSHKHWKLAELLLMNGASSSLIKAVPDLEIQKTCYAPPEGPSAMTHVRQYPGLCNKSYGVALALQNNSGVFLKPGFKEVSSKPNDNSLSVTVRDGKKSVSRIPELLCNNSKKVALALQSTSAVFLKPGVETFKEELASKPKRDVRDAMLKRVQYLMTLSRVGSGIGGNIFHGAVVAGDTALVKDLMNQPMFSSMMNTRKGLPLFALAVSNLDMKMMKLIQTSSKPIKDPIATVEKACQAIISLVPGVDGVIEKLRKWKQSEKDTDVKEKVYSLHNSLLSHYLKGKQMKFLASRAQYPLEEIAKEVIEMLPLSHEVKIPDAMLVALAILCNAGVFVHLKGKLRSTSDICSRIIVHGCTLTDLIMLLQCHRGEVSKALTAMAMIDTLCVDDTTLALAVRFNHVSFLKIVADSNLQRFPEKMLSKPWIDVFNLAVSKGNIDLLGIMLKVFEKNSPSNISQLLNEAFSVTSSKGYTDASQTLLQFATNTGTSNDIDTYSAAMKAAGNGMTPVLKTLLELCQKKQPLSDVKLSTLLELTGFSGSVPAFRVVLEFGDEPLTEKTETLSKCLPRALMNCVKKGHVELFLHVLETLPDVRLTEGDSHGATILHYACKCGSEIMVNKILEKNPKLAEQEDTEKKTPIDYARAMGQVSLLKDLSEAFKLRTTFKWPKESLHCGWLRYLLTRNSSEPLPPTQSTSMLYPPLSAGRKALTIEYALSQRNDEVALAMIFAAEEDIHTAMTHTYAEAPLLHFAAKYGSSKVLDALLTRLEEDQQTLRNILLTEIQGNIPLALAVQNKHKECVKILVERQNTTQWVSKKTDETLFHMAVLTGDKSILEILREKSVPESIHLKNNFGMEAGQYSIALGHQHLTSLFFENGFPTNFDHRSHKKTDYTCLDCLLDRCFGWSKVYLNEQKTDGPERNIWERGKTTSGYVSNSGNVESHILETLLQYDGIAKDVRILKSALACMGYKDDVDLARLFLLLSKGNDQMSNISLCLTKGWQSTTIAILEQTKAKLDLPSVLDAAIATHSVDVVKFILQKNPDVVSKEIEGITPLQTTVSLQMYDLYEEVLSVMHLTDTDQSHFANLDDIKVCLPLVARWKTRLSHPGDETWIRSLVDERLSEANCLVMNAKNPLLKKKVESTATLDSMLPETIIGKPLKVDLDSFKHNRLGGVSDSWLVTVIASYLTTLTTVLHQAHGLEEVDQIDIICLPSGTGSPVKELDGRTLKDQVALERHDQENDEEPILSISSNERLPNDLHNDVHFKRQVETDIISKAEILVHELVGHRVKIDVDWASFDEVDSESRSDCYSLLAGRDRDSELGGLVDVLGRCKELYGDIIALHGKSAMTCIHDLFTPLQKIVVTLSSTIQVPKKIMLFPCEESMAWVCSYKNDNIEFVVQNFPMYSRLKAYQTICVHSAGGVCTFSQDARAERQIYTDVSVDWKSFSSIGDTSTVATFGRNGLHMVICQLIVGLKCLLWYTAKPKKLILKNAASSSQADLLMDDEEIILALSASQPQSGMISGGIDITSKLHKIEVKQQIEHQIKTGGLFAGFTEFTGHELSKYNMPPEEMSSSRQTGEIYFKHLIASEIIPEAEKLVTELVGHAVNVRVDWSSFHATYSDEDITIYSMLAGRDPNNELGGLVHVIKRCLDLQSDNHFLNGQAMVESVKDLFTPIREIIIKHTGNLTKTNKTMFCLVDQSMPWYINFKDGFLTFAAESFPLYNILKACHSFNVNLNGGLRELENSVGNIKQNIEVYVDWKSFGNVGDTHSLSTVGRNGIQLEMLRLAAGVKHLLNYEFNVGKILLKNAPVSSQVNFTVEEGVLTLIVYAQRSHSGGWTTTGLDTYTQIKEMEVQYILAKGTELGIVPKKDLVFLAEKSGFRVLMPVEKRKWLEEIARNEGRQMTDPLELLKLYAAEYYTGSPVEKIEQELVEEILDALNMCPGVWPAQPEPKTGNVKSLEKQSKPKAGNMKTLKQQLPPGLWCWVTTAELGNGICYDTFLVKVRREGSSEYDFRLLRKRDAKLLPVTQVSGVWYHQPFDKKNDIKTIERLQLISFLDVLYHITDPFQVQKLLQNVPSKIQRGLTKSESQGQDEGTLFLPFDSWIPPSRLCRPHFDVVCQHSIVLHECWNVGSKIGINIVIDTDDLKRCGFTPATVERIAMDLSTTLDNFSSGVNMSTHKKRELLSTQGVLMIGTSNISEDHTTWTAQGMAHDDEYFSIYPLSDSDLYLRCEPGLALSEENVQKNVQMPKLLPRVKEKTSKTTFVSPRFSKILNVALGHRLVSYKSRELSNVIGDLSAEKPTVSFLEPAPDDSFVSYAETVFNNLITAFRHFASKVLKRKFPKSLKHIRVMKKIKDSDSNIVKFDEDHLTIFAVHKGQLTSIADMIIGLNKTMGKGLLSSESNLDNPQLVEGYQAYIPSVEAGFFNVRSFHYLVVATDYLRNTLASNRLLKLTLTRNGVMEKHPISIPHVSKEVQTLQNDVQVIKDKPVSNYTYSVRLDGRDLGEPIARGKQANQVTLVQRNPTLLLLPGHENICMGSGSNDTTSRDKERYGNIVRYIDVSAVEFEVSHKATFRMPRGSLTVGYSKGMYAFRMSLSRPEMFIRAKCKLCKSFLELHSTTCKANPGEYLQVLYEPHSKK